ncbi:MAG: protein kinase [Acidobacteria bacterium]|nr:protein kinase [Acidobacteriota bacterium]
MTLCRVEFVAAVALVLVNFYSLATRPSLGFDYSTSDARVLSVTPGGPAARAGIAPGDRVLSINGDVVAADAMPLFFVRAGQSVPVIVQRGENVRTIALSAVSAEEQREEALRAGGARAVSAITGYLNYPLHIWMLGLAAALLVLRPGNFDARLAALSLTSWAGSLFLFRYSGMGIVLDALPAPAAWLLVALDGTFSAGFFAVNLHFALVFASERATRVSRTWQTIPYIAALPIFIETYANGMLRLRHDVHAAALPFANLYSPVGSLLLVASLVALAVRFSRMRDANARRRLLLLFLALLPGTIAFAFGYLVDALHLGYGWEVTARLLHTPTTMLGSSIFAYAVVRHRMFNIRVLVRRSLQYALARGTLLAVMSLPLIGLALFLYAHRRDSLAVLLTGTPAVYLLVILPLLAVVRYRKPLLEALDRRFFREQYDARRLLLHVVSIIRGGSDMLALSRAALDEIDKALHPKHLSLWQADSDGAELRRGFARGDGTHETPPLAVSGTLATLLSADDEPLDIHSRQTRTLLQRLPGAERDWLRSTDAYLLVPLLIEKRLGGLLVLGERKSEEPYSREDRELLRMLGAQLALTLDYSRLKQSPSLVWGTASSPAPVHLFVSDGLQLCPRCGRCYAADARQCENDEQALVPESGVPRMIEDKYVVTRLLGRGGMGSVYLATQTRLNRPVAIKVLLSHLVGSSSMRTRFEREARIVARLRHPAIVTIHDFGVLPSGHAYLVMEYLDGDTLRKTITSGPQALAPALGILRPVAEAIDAAHRAGVVHRDLKPENIMLVRDDANSTPRVLDFGLAKMTGPIGEDEATLVQSNHSAGVVGTLMYMAPEVLSGHAADARADQYSLALIAYELLAGEHPLGRSTDLASVVRGHTETAMMPIRSRVDVPQHVSDAIDRALSKRADARFASVGEFLAALG